MSQRKCSQQAAGAPRSGTPKLDLGSQAEIALAMPVTTRSLVKDKSLGKKQAKCESEVVTKRLEDVRRDIADLKQELDRLIQQGISNNKADVGLKNTSLREHLENKLEDIQEKSVPIATKEIDVADKIEVVKTRVDNIVSKLEEQDKDRGSHINNKTEKHCEATQDSAPNENSSKVPKFNYLNTTIAKSPSVPSLECKTLHKVRHYDPQAARDYIKLQKERRKQVLQNQQKESVQLAIDIKKQRLKELQQKSLHLVIKSNKRHRSRSEGERVAQESVHNHNDNDLDVKKDAVVPIDRVAQDLASQQLCDKVTVRSKCNGEGDVPRLEVSESNLSNHSKEESRARKGRSLNANANISSEDKSKSAHSNGIGNTPSILSNRDGLSRVTIRPHYADVTDGELQIPPETKLHEILKEKLAMRSELKPNPVRTEPEFPSWLDAPSVAPYTCNFISAVRKKLQLAVNNNSHQNVSVQTNLVIGDTPKRTRSLEEAKREIKDILEKSGSQKNTDLKSFLSHKCLELKLKDPKLSERSDSDTSKNIPDISTESATGIDTKSINDLKLVLPRRRKLAFEQPKGVETSEVITNGNHRSGSKSGSLEDKSKSKFRVLSGDDTIISSNKWEYSEDLVSPKTVPEDLLSAGTETVNRDSPKHLIVQTQLGNNVTVSIPSSDDIDNNSIETANSILSSNSAKNYDVMKENSKNGDIISVKSSEANDYASDFTSATTSSLSSVPSLKIPSVSLKPEMKTSFFQTTAGPNRIHIKFEAELHSLNEFNESLRQIMEIEKLQDRKSTTTAAAVANLQTKNTQTTIRESSSEIIMPASINFTRGCSESEDTTADDNVSVFETTLVTTGLEVSQITEDLATESSGEQSFADMSRLGESVYAANPQIGVSLDMFEQLIKDEDARIENLKTILKIREKALVDRTKGELALLEILKRNLRDSGHLQEISTIKKKQRGLLVKLEHERHEMQRLKQMQKAASRERKSVLREQRNMIKAQLSTNGTTITKIRRNRAHSSSSARRQSGPLRVYSINTESARSEVSISSRAGSVANEEEEVGMHSQSVVSRCSQEVRAVDNDSGNNRRANAEFVKRSLLMREAALHRRRKTAEELLQWHQRLIEEEAEVAELETATKAIIMQIPSGAVEMEPGGDERIALQPFRKDTKTFVLMQSKTYNRKVSRCSSSGSDSEAVRTQVSRSGSSRSTTYSSDFEQPSLQVVVKSEPLASQTSVDMEIKGSGSEIEEILKLSSEGSFGSAKPVQDIATAKFPSGESLAQTHFEKQFTNVSSELSSSSCGIPTATSQNASSKAQTSLVEESPHETLSREFISEEPRCEKSSDVLHHDCSGSRLSTASSIQELSHKTASLDNENISTLISSTSKCNSDIQSASIQEQVSKESSTVYEKDVPELVASNKSPLTSSPMSSAVQEEVTPKVESSIAPPSEVREEMVSSNEEAESIPGSNYSSSTKPKDSSAETENDGKSLSVSEDSLTEKEIIRKSVSSGEQVLDIAPSILEEPTTSLADDVIPELASSVTEDSVTSDHSSTVQVIVEPNSDEVPFISEDSIDTSPRPSLGCSEAKEETAGEFESLPVSVKSLEIDEQSSTKSISLVNEDISLPVLTSQHSSESTNSFLKTEGTSKQHDKAVETALEFEHPSSFASIEAEGGTKYSERQEEKADVSRASSKEMIECIQTPEELAKECTTISTYLESKNALSSKVIEEVDTTSPKSTTGTNEDSATKSLNNSIRGFIEDEEILELALTKSIIQTDDLSDVHEEVCSKGMEESDTSLQSGDSSLLKLCEEVHDTIAVGSDTSDSTNLERHTNFEIPKESSEDTKSLENADKLLSQDISIYPNEEIFTKPSYGDDRVENASVVKPTEATSNGPSDQTLESASKNSSQDSSISVSEEIFTKSVTDHDVALTKPAVRSKEETSIDSSKPPSNEELSTLRSSQVRVGVENEQNSSLSFLEVSKENSSSTSEFVEKALDEILNHSTKTSDKSNLRPSEELDDNKSTEKTNDKISSKQESSIQNGYIVEKSQNGDIAAASKKLQQESDCESSDESLQQHTTVDEDLPSDRDEEISKKSNTHSSEEEDSGEQKTHIDEDTSKTGSDSSRTSGMDIRKRVSEILADAQLARNERSPSMQEMYTTAYGVVSPEKEVGAEKERPFNPKLYVNKEVEELFKKQLAIEQEIKEIERQQKKEQLPYLYVREIPNKPPPPYTPPHTAAPTPTGHACVLPVSTDQIDNITKHAAEILYNNPPYSAIRIPDAKYKHFSRNIEKPCIDFVFDLCKEIAGKQHDKEIAGETGPSWMQLTKKPKLAFGKALDQTGLERLINAKVRELLGYEKLGDACAENVKLKWCGKKRDHVDEILLRECQQEEAEWTNYDRDELIVKRELTEEIMNVLLVETAQVFQGALDRRATRLC